MRRVNEDIVAAALAVLRRSSAIALGRRRPWPHRRTCSQRRPARPRRV